LPSSHHPEAAAASGLPPLIGLVVVPLVSAGIRVLRARDEAAGSRRQRQERRRAEWPDSGDSWRTHGRVIRPAPLPVGYPADGRVDWSFRVLRDRDQHGLQRTRPRHWGDRHRGARRGLAGFLGFGVVTTVTEMTRAGLTFRYNLRRKTIPWASVEAFRVARGRGTGLWWSLMVEVRGSEPVLVGSVVGTQRYVRRVIAEMEEFRAKAAAG
jgi:hypothetical protein